jgi:hypothetical protein
VGTVDGCGRQKIDEARIDLQTMQARMPAGLWRAMMQRWLRYAFAATLVAGLVLRALTPAGYMPAALADGTPFVLCPNSTPGAGYFLDRGHDAHSQHHHHGTDQKPSADSPWEFCPFGAAFAAAAPAPEMAPTIEPGGTSDPAVAPPVIPRSAPSRAFRARGPPAFAA